jgi:hypothetical protein
VFSTTTVQPPPEQPGDGDGNGDGQGAIDAQVRALIERLQTAQAQAQAALRSGDLTAYAEAQQRVAAIIRQLGALAE